MGPWGKGQSCWVERHPTLPRGKVFITETGSAITWFPPVPTKKGHWSPRNVGAFSNWLINPIGSMGLVDSPTFTIQCKYTSPLDPVRIGVPKALHGFGGRIQHLHLGVSHGFLQQKPYHAAVWIKGFQWESGRLHSRKRACCTQRCKFGSVIFLFISAWFCFRFQPFVFGGAQRKWQGQTTKSFRSSTCMASCISSNCASLHIGEANHLMMIIISTRISLLLSCRTSRHLDQRPKTMPLEDRNPPGWPPGSTTTDPRHGAMGSEGPNPYRPRGGRSRRRSCGERKGWPLEEGQMQNFNHLWRCDS